MPEKKAKKNSENSKVLEKEKKVAAAISETQLKADTAKGESKNARRKRQRKDEHKHQNKVEKAVAQTKPPLSKKNPSSDQKDSAQPLLPSSKDGKVKSKDFNLFA